MVYKMDSIEKMRRLNELTKELKQHGFAESSFEAIQQANQIYGDDDVTSEVKDGIIRNSPQEKLEKSGENTMDDGAMINMDKKLVKLNENVNTLTDKLNEIIKALNDMDSRINQLKNRPPERIIEKTAEKLVEHDPEHQSDHVEAHAESHAGEDKEYTNQRVGNYQSQDVAIDKMFYYGKK